ncbi:helix-turn-helix domain-containing protein [Hymenobacter metallicola]|uniref:Helix-turn-helix domain-containing protein n=1 Tax=Hymenobacter metallicola TaxID=2563114 RepID=A0A4Z0QBL1_9BACT|nr:helix-turn-helix domain-containing protein [Hymenobacter metallicola]TGE26543.1 helix-turn-helix domain-containing protein [Hymenobacter metallicola]
MEWIPGKLRTIRQEFKMTQLEMAQASGLSQRDISQLENGRKEGLPKEFIHFLHARGVDLNWLFTNPSHEPEPVSEISSTVKEYGTEEDRPAIALAQEDGPVRYGEAQRPMPRVVTTDRLGASAIHMIGEEHLHQYPRLRTDSKFYQALPVMALALPEVQGGTFRCFQVADASMLPTLAVQDWVIGRFASATTIENGRLGVVITRDAVLVRRVFRPAQPAGVLLLKAEAADVADREVDPADILEMWSVQGRLSWHLPIAEVAAEPKVAALEADLKNLLERVRRLEQGR